MHHSISDTRPLGRSGVSLPILGFGTAPLGNMLKATSPADATASLERAWAAGIRHFDTAPQYGCGLAEHRLGQVLREKPRDGWLLSTKVGRLLRARRPGTQASSIWIDALPFEVDFDYSYDAAMRSLEDSMQRLGMDRIDLVMIHDVSVKWQGLQVADRFRQAMRGAHRALAQLRGEGVIKAFGVGVNDNVTATRFVEEGAIDYVMIAGRYTLLDMSALETLLPACARRQVGVMMAGPFNSGILATGSSADTVFHYNPPPPEILEKVRAIESAGRRHGVALQAAALQFPLSHPAVTSIVSGFRTPAEVEQAVAWLQQPIAADFWHELRALGLLPEASA